MKIKLEQTTRLKNLAKQVIGQPSSIPIPPQKPLSKISYHIQQLLNLAREAFQIDDFDGAKKYYCRAAKAAVVSSTAKMVCHYELAQVYTHEARALLNQVRTTSQASTGLFFTQLHTRQYLKQIYQQVVTNFNQAFLIAKELDDQSNKIKILRNMAKSYSSLSGFLTHSPLSIFLTDLKQWSAVFFAIQGKPNKTAKRIEQQEVGFSSSIPIGTEQIQQCVVILARDPITNKTGIAHIDTDTDPRSLETMLFSKIVKGKLSKTLEVRLIGGFLEKKSFILNLLRQKNFSFDLVQREIDKSSIGINDKNAFRNIRVVLNALLFLAQKGYNIEILSSDLAQSVEERPTAIVVYPQNGLLKAESPANFHPDKWIRSGTLIAGSCSLRMAFDDDVYYPIKLCSEQIRALWNKYHTVYARGEFFLLKTITQEIKEQHPQASEDWLAVCINSQFGQARAFFDANNQIIQWCTHSQHTHNPLQLKQIYLGIKSTVRNKKLIQDKTLYLQAYDNEQIYNIVFPEGAEPTHGNSAMFPEELPCQNSTNCYI